ncbi:hypothetical protein [Micromonospora sp. CPCC 205561]|uniref:hypothetical protein n=1 Tax=Micromonospora sp. CPCC 205561 TaxID=3122407 RepID=UPI002FF0E01E
MRRIRTAIALLGMPLFVLLGSTPASAAASIDVTSGTLVVRGVAVDLTISVACPAGRSGSFELVLRQRSGNRIAYGSGWAPVGCTGAPQEVTGRVWAATEGAVFRSGEALVTGSTELCGQDTCEYGQIDDTVRVTH